MANSFTTQVISQGPNNYIIKLTGVLDASDLASTVAVDPSTFTDNDTGTECLIIKRVK